MNESETRCHLLLQRDYLLVGIITNRKDLEDGIKIWAAENNGDLHLLMKGVERLLRLGYGPYRDVLLGWIGE